MTSVSDGFKICTAQTNNDDATINAWKMNECNDVFLTEWNKPTGFEQLKNGFGILIPKVLDSDNELHVLRDMLVDVCRGFPGTCDLALDESCPQLDHNTIINDKNLSYLCGCFLDYPDQPECYPLCTKSGAVQRSNTRGEIQRCDKNVCIITSDSMNFKTPYAACPTCQNNNCVCIYRNSNPDKLQEEFTKINPGIASLCGNGLLRRTIGSTTNGKTKCNINFIVIGIAIVVITIIVAVIVIMMLRKQN